jgi:hypothetical protein
MTLYNFPLPAKINGDQLQAELGAESVYVIGDKLFINSDKTEDTVKAAVAAHVPAPFAGPSVNEKLEIVGLSIDDLKAALGL